MEALYGQLIQCVTSIGAVKSSSGTLPSGSFAAL